MQNISAIDYINNKYFIDMRRIIMKAIKLTLILSVIFSIFAISAKAGLEITDPIEPETHTNAYIGFSAPIGNGHSFSIFLYDNIHNNTARITDISPGGTYLNTPGSMSLSLITYVSDIIGPASFTVYATSDNGSGSKTYNVHFYGNGPIDGPDVICKNFGAYYTSIADPDNYYVHRMYLDNPNVPDPSKYYIYYSERISWVYGTSSILWGTPVQGTFDREELANKYFFGGSSLQEGTYILGAGAGKKDYFSSKEVKVIGPEGGDFCDSCCPTLDSDNCASGSCGSGGGASLHEPIIISGEDDPGHLGNDDGEPDEDDGMSFTVVYYDTREIEQQTMMPPYTPIKLIAKHYHVYSKRCKVCGERKLVFCYTAYDYPKTQSGSSTSIYNNSIVTLPNDWTMQNIDGELKMADDFGGIHWFGSSDVEVGRNMKLTLSIDAFENKTFRTDEGIEVETPNGLITYWEEHTKDSDYDILTKEDSYGNETTYTYTTVNGKKYVTSVNTNSPNEVGKSKTITRDPSGNITRISQGETYVDYSYDSLNGNYGVIEEVLDQNNNKLKETQYEYGADVTIVRAVDINNPSNVRETKYTFLKDIAGKKKEILQVENALAGVNTSYLWLDSRTVNVAGLVENTDYKTTTNAFLFGKPWKTTDAKGRVTLYSYDSKGNTTRIDYPGGGYESFGYNSRGQQTFYTNKRGITTTYNYATTAPYALIFVSKAGTTLKSLQYYPSTDQYGQAGKLMKETVTIESYHTKTTEYEYYEIDGNNNVIPRDEATKISTTYSKTMMSPTYTDTKTVYNSYDEYGDLISTTDPLGKTVSFTSTKTGSEVIKSTVYGTGIASQQIYDCCHLTSSIDESGRSTYYSYRADGKPIATWTDISGQSETTPTIINSYNGFGDLLETITRSAAGTSSSFKRKIYYNYDKLGRATRIDYPSDTGPDSFSYDKVGNIAARRNGKLIYTAYKYDTADRLTHVFYNYTGTGAQAAAGTYPADNTADVKYTYVGNSDLVSTITDSTGTTTFTYDNFDRVTSVASSYTGKTVYYGYNTLGQKTYVRNGSSTANQTNYTYKAGLLDTVKLNTTLIASYEYDGAGNRTKTTYGNGTWQRYVYKNDPRYLMDKIYYAYKPDANSSVTEVEALGFGQDNSGNTTTIYDVGSSNILKTFSYDQNARLSSYNGAGTPIQNNYTYDWIGNRTNNTSTYNNASLLTSDNRNSYTYDRNGSLTEISGADNMTFTYNPQNLMESATNGNNTMEFYWDAMSNRVGLKTSDDEVYKFVYDYTAKFPAIIEEFDGYTASYIREPDGSLICRNISGVYNYYHFDQQGSTLFLTGNNGMVTDTYIYDDWGNLVDKTGSTLQPFKYIGKYGYYAHFQDDSVMPYTVASSTTSGTVLSFIQTGVRTYFPRLGRYMQVDPIKDGINFLAYCDNDPINFFDPDGLKKINKEKWGRILARCVENKRYAAKKAMKKYQSEAKSPLVSDGRDPANAILHCVWACESKRKCGALVSMAGVYGYEADTLWNKDLIVWFDSEMDLINDAAGFKVAGTNANCYNGCKKKLCGGELSWNGRNGIYWYH